MTPFPRPTRREPSRSWRRLAAASALVAGIAAGGPAQALGYHFVQTGFADGATVSGSFAGEDRDQDGWIYASELSRFSLDFSGNRAVEAFVHGMDNRAGFVFEVATQSLLHLATTGPDGSRFLEYDAFGWPGYHIPGRVTDNRTGLSSITWERLQLAPVPEPGAGALLLAGLAAVGGLMRRRAPKAL